MITLSRVMKANAISCIGFGISFVFFPDEVRSFLSSDNEAPRVMLLILGAGLFLNGLHLTWTSLKPVPSKRLVLYFSISDYLWVISTSCLLSLGIWITSPEGILCTLLVSGMVGTFGYLQMIKRKEMGSC